MRARGYRLLANASRSRRTRVRRCLSEASADDLLRACPPIPRCGAGSEERTSRPPSCRATKKAALRRAPYSPWGGTPTVNGRHPSWLHATLDRRAGVGYPACQPVVGRVPGLTRSAHPRGPLPRHNRDGYRYGRASGPRVPRPYCKAGGSHPPVGRGQTERSGTRVR